MRTPPELDTTVPLVGRRDELARIFEAIASGGLCTLAGPGGAGKTRLAVEAAHRSGWDFVFVSLAGTAAGGAAAAVARQLGADAAPGLEPAVAVEESLRAMPRALLLDNCEHLFEEARALCERIVGIEGAFVLATSRRKLELPDERVVEVGPLDAVDANAFVLACLQKQRATFVPDAGDRERIASIASSLDGLPVAIELATSRYPANTVAQLARALRSIVPSQLQTADAPETRHRTLQRTVEWSVSLLDDATRRIFQACSIFAGWFDADDASAVATEGVASVDVRAALELLAEHSLIARAGAHRYSMLAPIHAVARRIAPAATQAAFAARHAVRMRDIAEALRATFVATDLSKIVSAIGARYGDFVAALDWALRHHQLIETGAELAQVMGVYWVEGGHVVDGAEWLLRAISAAEGAKLEPQRMATLGYTYARICHAAGDYAKIVERGPALVGAFTQAGDRLGLGRAYNLMSVAALCTGAVDDAEAFGGTALAIYSAIEHGNGVAAALCNLGNAALDGRDDPAGAIEQYERALAVAMRPGGEGVRVLLHGNLAETYYAMDRMDDSEASCRRAIEAAAKLGNDAYQAWAHTILARIALRRGDRAAASAALRTALRDLGTGTNAEYLAAAVEIAGRIALARGSLDEAAKLLVAGGRFRTRYRLLQLGLTVAEARHDRERALASLGPQEAARADRESRALSGPRALLAAAKTSLEV